VVDVPDKCNFYVPATVRRGALTLAVSTSGSSPLLARRIRERLELEFDQAYEPYLVLLAELRPRIQQQVPDPVRRKSLWAALLDSDVLDLLRDGQAEAARDVADQLLRDYR
jgi:precorrin-2 dehydrogenase/sirohydrochlorin ferrochelatase